MNGYNHTNGSIPGPSHPHINGGTTSDIQIPQGPTNQPRVLVRSINDTDAVFHLSGVETGYANSLRRVMMADVPTICMSFLSLEREKERRR
jgi:DNA-directed RNA polymerase II subunit RPB3